MKKIILYIKLFYYHIQFWTFPTLEETYYLNIGAVYFDMNKFHKAIRALEKSEKAHDNQNPSFSKFNWYYLAYSYLNIGAFKKAIIYFEKSLIFYRNNFEIVSILGWCYELNNEHEAALASYKSASELEPNILHTYIAIVNLLAESNRKEEALALLKDIEPKFEDSFERKIIKVLSYKIIDDLTNAINELSETIKKLESTNRITENSKYNDLCMLLARYLREKGDFKNALLILESAREKDPADLWLINLISMEYADQNLKLAEALQLIDTALIFQPENPIFLDTKGWILFKLGRKREAIDIINKSLSLCPNCKETKDHLGVVLNS